MHVTYFNLFLLFYLVHVRMYDVWDNLILSETADNVLSLPTTLDGFRCLRRTEDATTTLRICEDKHQIKTVVDKLHEAQPQ